MGVAHVLFLGAVALAAADDLLPPDRPMAEVVDHYVDARPAKEGVKPAAEADDATLVRRLTLDLDGRMPRRPRSGVRRVDRAGQEGGLVDRLMASPGSSGTRPTASTRCSWPGRATSLRDYLIRAFGEDRPWDAVFRDLLVGDESEPGRKGASGFLKARAKDLDRLTSDVSSVFFGVNVSCAKCHDHPQVKDWKQDHYYGMKSFLGRTFEVNGFVGERGFGAVKFKPTEGEEKPAKFLFLTGRSSRSPGADEPSKEEKKEEKQRIDEAKKKKRPRRRRRSAPGRSSSRSRWSRAGAILRAVDRQPPLGPLLRLRPGDAARPDALGEPAEPPGVARLARPRHGRAPLRPSPADPGPGPEPGLRPRRAAGSRPSPRPPLFAVAAVRPLDAAAARRLDVGGDHRPREPARRPDRASTTRRSNPLAEPGPSARRRRSPGPARTTRSAPPRRS